MSIVGSTDHWSNLLEGMLPKLLQIVLNTWPSMQNTLTSDKEDKITEILCKQLRKSRDREALPFSVDTQLVELEPAPGQLTGRLDIVFRPTGGFGPPNEEIYFCLECKRLNHSSGKKKQAGASKYVMDGMMRFVYKQYSKSVKHGAMLGYVLDGNIQGAIKNVEQNIKKKHVILCMESPGQLQPSSILPAIPTAKETIHARVGDTSAFRIHHFFMKADDIFVVSTTT